MRGRLTVTIAIVFLALASGPAQGSGTLYDAGVLQTSFNDCSDPYPMTAEHDGTWMFTGSSGSNRLSRYSLAGDCDQIFYLGIDYRSLYLDNNGQLFAKAYGGGIYSITPDGVATYLYTLSDPESQSAGSLSADDVELYTMQAPTLRRYNHATGDYLGEVTLQGMAGSELGFPQAYQMETTGDGRILTYADGVVSEWDLTGTRIGQCTIPIATPADFSTNWSFGVSSDGDVYLYNANTIQWEVYDVGAGGPPTPSEATSWGRLKSHYR